MAQQLFRFKKFNLEQGGAVHPVGTDGVLLGCWASIEDTDRRILDVGTGTGLVALMLAQRSENQSVEKIIGVEIHPETAKLALQNFENSAWQHRLEVVQSSFQNFAKNCPTLFDLIVSNPPFFSEKTRSPDPTRDLGRHCESLPPIDLIAGVKKLLTPRGRFCVILPNKMAQHCCEIAAVQGLYFSKMVEITTVAGKVPTRMMLEFHFSSTFYSFEKWYLDNPAGKFHQLTSEFYCDTVA